MANTILNSALVTVGSTVAAEMLPPDLGGKGELPAPRLLFGTLLTFTGLSLLADMAPGVANPLAVCIAVTALTYYGLPLLENYTTRDQPNYKAKKVG
jgi:hypothetical protein